MSLWRNDSVNVVANSNWSSSLISAPKVHWRVQPTAAIVSTTDPQELSTNAWKGTMTT